MRIDKNSREICNRCGLSVAFGSGKFINRVPDLNDLNTKIFYKRQFPRGEYICVECDEESSR